MRETVIYPGKFYVYQWLSANGECLYIGKGSGERAWKLERPELHTKMGGERPQYVRLLLWVDSEEDALYYERKLIGARSPRWNFLGILHSTDTGKRERPYCRRVILREGYRPFVKRGFWDSWTCMQLDGRSISLSPNMRVQMRKMVAEKHWGDIRVDTKLWPIGVPDDVTHKLK